MEEAQAGVDFLDVRLSLTRIESPVEGIVAQVNTQEGEQVVAELEAVNIVTILDPRFLDLWVYVNEADAAGVRPGMALRFFKASKPAEIMAGVVSRVSPTPELQDGVRFYPVIASLPLETAARLRPEMNLQCMVLAQELKGVLSVPVEAVFLSGGQRVVYTQAPGGPVRAVSPRFGLWGNKRVQVLEGLEKGARVAVELDASVK